jgi:hypothetical protein
MPLDPNDPLIPLPWQMDRIRAYRAGKELAAEEDALKMQKLRLDVEEKLSERPESKISKAAELYQAMEQLKQEQEGIPFEAVAKQAALDENMNLLEANKQQGLYNIEQAGLRGKMAGIEAQLTGQKSLVPTEQYKYQGVSGTALGGQGAAQLSNARRNVFQADYNDFYDMAKFQGADDQQAHQIAIQKSEQKALKSQDKIVIALPGGGTFASTPEKINQMRDDPSTPQEIRDAIIAQWGAGNKQTAQSWLSSRIPKAVK